ncbi:MAG TPA: hypothetical protein VL357_12810 [Rariglobus sp.]|jgi:hypothetical protein|nr:hypothetical protein [Rariglobus sp.]
MPPKSKTRRARSADALTKYIVTSALIYARGQWSGEDVAKDMLRGGGITRTEINLVTKDKDERKKLCSLLNHPAVEPPQGRL